MRRLFPVVVIIAALLAAAFPLSAQRGDLRYALVLEDPPLAKQVSSRMELMQAASDGRSRSIESAQRALRDELKSRNIYVTGAVHILLNAVFVRVPKEKAAELKNLPGVNRVAYLPPIKLSLNRAAPLVNAPAAWAALGGTGQAGKGVKIGLLDTGIDQTHPAFQDPSLVPPAGFPRCTVTSDCDSYTNSKIIVARSYVSILAAGFSATNDPVEIASTSHPDDLSARDHVGHGTANGMIAAGRPVTAPNGIAITGIAPRAYLGSYKIFGSPGVNDFTFADAVVTALEDAFTDGMDIVSISLGLPATYGPLDTGATCFQTTAGTPCDPEAAAIQTAVSQGLTVVVAGGNDGDSGVLVPTLNTISSPATAPDAIAVGASTNSHAFFYSLRVSGSDVPANLQQIPALFGDGPALTTPLSAPLVDVTTVSSDGTGCTPISGTPLTGSIALVLRGTCYFATKVTNAQAAGAVGVVIIDYVVSTYPFPPKGLSQTGIPAMLITNTAGLALQTFLFTHQGRQVTMDPSLAEVDATPDMIAGFSSLGPTIGTYAIKPELVAVGTGVFTATQNYDPNSGMYDASRFAAFDGTSFSTPIVAGAAALVKQAKPNLTALQVKSALVNTASNTINDVNGLARVAAVGAGKLSVVDAINTQVAVSPATLSFGVIIPGTTSAGITRTLTFSNISGGQVNLVLSPLRRDSDPNTQITLNPSSFSIPSGGSPVNVTVQLKGSQPAAGSYEGEITVQGAGTSFRVPFLYLVGSGVPFNILPVLGTGADGIIGQLLASYLIGFKLIDQFGVPVTGAPVGWFANDPSGYIYAADSQTDIYGIAAAEPVLGFSPGDQIFTGGTSTISFDFDVVAYVPTTINANGVQNAATDEPATTQKGVAPGSYIEIKGAGLSDSLAVFGTNYLPLSLAGVSVSFDIPSLGISLPGHIHFVSYGQINVQVPWELEGQSSVLMKVSIGDISSAVVTVPLARNSPGFFQYPLASGIPASEDENYNVITTSNPVARGHVAQLFCNGLGPVTLRPASGEEAPLSPLIYVTDSVSVTIGGKTASVEFKGLTPTGISLYQVNVRVPLDTPTGLQPVVMTVGGVTAMTVNLPVN